MLSQDRGPSTRSRVRGAWPSCFYRRRASSGQAHVLGLNEHSLIWTPRSHLRTNVPAPGVPAADCPKAASPGPHSGAAAKVSNRVQAGQQGGAGDQDQILGGLEGIVHDPGEHQQRDGQGQDVEHGHGEIDTRIVQLGCSPSHGSPSARSSRRASHSGIGSGGMSSTGSPACQQEGFRSASPPGPR